MELVYIQGIELRKLVSLAVEQEYMKNMSGCATIVAVNVNITIYVGCIPYEVIM